MKSNSPSNCIVCKKQFFSRDKAAKCCSRECADEYHKVPDHIKEAEFWSLVDKADGCWLWFGRISKPGYGIFWNSHGLRTAHRYSYFLHYGDFDRQMYVLHKCDVRNCVNPNHLYLGTHQDNMADRTARDRASKGDDHWTRKHPEKILRGERIGVCKLTEEKVRQIREMATNMRQNQIAKIFGIGTTAINYIVLRKSWKHVV